MNVYAHAFSDRRDAVRQTAHRSPREHTVSTGAKPRTKTPEKRREDLMNAAARLFLDQGVAATTVEQITTGAGVAKGSFYLHFASKEAVIDGLRQRFIDRLRTGIAAAVERQPENDWCRKLAAWAMACGRGYRESMRLHELVFGTAPPATHDGLSDNILIDHLAELLAAGHDADAWAIEDTRFTAIFLFNALHGVVLAAASLGDDAAIELRTVAHCFSVVGLPRAHEAARDCVIG